MSCNFLSGGAFFNPKPYEFEVKNHKYKFVCVPAESYEQAVEKFIRWLSLHEGVIPVNDDFDKQLEKMFNEK